MTISALVVTLSNEDDARARVLAELGADSRIICGEPQGLRLPVVTETGSLTEAKELVEALASLPGISFIDVVSTVFEDEVS